MSRKVALIPAAGVGQRFGAPCPKQYIDLAGQTVLQHTVNRLLRLNEIELLLIVVSIEDTYIDNVNLVASWPKNVHVLRCGGSTRAETVKNGLTIAYTQFGLQQDDWILVHDAARCCVCTDSVVRLIKTVQFDKVGGLLAIPVSDTLKLADEKKQVCTTVDRKNMWLAQTPQMFRFGILIQALAHVDLFTVTDEASAVEALGFAPKLVAGDVSNLKLTTQQDLALVKFFLQQEQTL